MSKIFFVADTHFGSEIAHKYTWSRRRFKDHKAVDREMIKNWNKTVGPNDTVYFLGDFAHKDMPLEKQLWYRNFLNGSIVMVRGNHDLFSKEQYEKEMNIEWFYEEPFLLKDISGELPNLHLCHYPVERDDFYYTLTGHIHEKWRVARNMLNVGVDANNFTPLSMSDVLFCINAEREHHWDANVYPDAPIEWRWEVTKDTTRNRDTEPTYNKTKEEYEK